MIGFASDHAGMEMRFILLQRLRTKGYRCIDYGIHWEDALAGLKLSKQVAEDIVNGKIEKGILLCGTGVGMSISANKVPGIRAGLCSDVYTAGMMVRHNDANILAMGARVVGPDLAEMIACEFLEAKFEGGRHVERIRAIENAEDD